jgi:hypothetical protein
MLAVPSLLYTCKIRTFKQGDIRRLKTAEMKFMRPTAGYSLLYHKRNEDILVEFEVDPLIKKVAHYTQKLSNHVSRMKTSDTQNTSLTIDLSEEEEEEEDMDDH